MRLGICSWAFAGIIRGTRPLQELARVAAQHGFEVFEGAFQDRGTLTAQRTPVPLPVPLGSLASLQFHRLPLTSPVARRRRAGVDLAARMVACASAWGVPSVSLSPGPCHAGQSLSAALDLAAQGLGTILEQAAAANVAVAVENLPGHCLATREAMAALLDRLGHGTGVCLDLGNALADPPVDAWIDAFAGRLIKVHLSDARRTSNELQATDLGSGDLDWQATMDALARAGFAGDCYVEAPLPAGEDEQAFVTRVAAHARRIWVQ